MFALGHITADTRSRIGSTRITGRIRDVIDILNDREERALTTDKLVRLLTNTSLPTLSRIRLFVALVVRARAGNEGDLPTASHPRTQDLASGCYTWPASPNHRKVRARYRLCNALIMW